MTAARDRTHIDAIVPRLAALARDGAPRHVVICLFNAMGDAFLALPVVRFIVESFGRQHVSLWVNAYHGRTIYAEFGDIVIASTESNRNAAAERKVEEVAALRRRLPAAAALSWVSLNPYEPRTVVEDYAIDAIKPQSLWEFRGTHLRVDESTGSVLHRMDQYFRVIGEHPTPAVDRRPMIGPVARERAAAIRDHVHRMSRRLIAVHAETKAHKCWPQSHWRELGELLRNDGELVILGLTGQLLSRSGAYLTAPQGWEKQVAILAHADVFVGIDSCFSHVADAFHLPGAILYGDTAMLAQWRPKEPMLAALVAEDGDLAKLAAADVAARMRLALDVAVAPYG